MLTSEKENKDGGPGKLGCETVRFVQPKVASKSPTKGMKCKIKNVRFFLNTKNAFNVAGIVVVLQVLGVNVAQQKRDLSLQEHYSMKLLQDAGIITPKGGVASTPDQAFEIASVLGELRRNKIHFGDTITIGPSL